jgi:thiol-disulfide isomerase/thioredoxin/outer membrane lipoprotein-sorting protein
MLPAFGAFLCVMASWISQPQASPKGFADGAALLDAVAKIYAADAETFHFESVTETLQNNELQRSWQKSFQSVFKAPGNRFWIETRNWTGTWMQASDGATEWVYLSEAKMYTKRNAGNGPQFPKTYGMGTMGLKQAWDLRTTLDVEAEHAKNATMLPEETIEVEGQRYPCYVVHSKNDSNGLHSEETFWIEKRTLMMRKEVKQQEVLEQFSPILKIAAHEETTTLYPVADLHPPIDAKVFAFAPPSDAQEVSTLEPEVQGFATPPATHAVGRLLPDISLTGADGKEMKLSSFRGRPLLIDVWATWCGPCLEWMPSLGGLEREMRGKGLQVISVDRDEVAENATHYLAVHEFPWPNYHDREGTLGKALGEERIPLTLLIDAEGRIAYLDVNSGETALRKAIAGLLPEQGRHGR